MSVEIKRELGVFSITMLKTNWHPKCQQRDLQVHQREWAVWTLLLLSVTAISYFNLKTQRHVYYYVYYRHVRQTKTTTRNETAGVI